MRTETAPDERMEISSGIVLVETQECNGKISYLSARPCRALVYKGLESRLSQTAMLGPDRWLSRHSNMANRIRLIGIKVYEGGALKGVPFSFE